MKHWNPWFLGGDKTATGTMGWWWMMGWDWQCYITLHLRSKHEFPLEKSWFNRAAIEIKPHGIVSVASGGKCWVTPINSSFGWISPKIGNCMKLHAVANSQKLLVDSQCLFVDSYCWNLLEPPEPRWFVRFCVGHSSRGTQGLDDFYIWRTRLGIHSLK